MKGIISIDFLITIERREKKKTIGRERDGEKKKIKRFSSQFDHKQYNRSSLSFKLEFLIIYYGET